MKAGGVISVVGLRKNSTGQYLRVGKKRAAAVVKGEMKDAGDKDRQP